MIFSLFIVAICVVGVVAVVAFVLRRVWGGSVIEALPFTPVAPPPAAPSVRLASAQEMEIRDLLVGGNKIAAIKRLRELTGFGLADAKRAVEDMQQGVAIVVRPDTLASAPSGDSAADPELQQSLARGNTIAAIKRVRELTGMGLKQAKDYVEGIGAGQVVPLVASETTASRDLAEVAALAAVGQKIEAIKLYRAITGLGLKEAKDYVDALPRPPSI